MNSRTLLFQFLRKKSVHQQLGGKFPGNGLGTVGPGQFLFLEPPGVLSEGYGGLGPAVAGLQLPVVQPQARQTMERNA